MKKKLDLQAISFFLPSIKSNCFVYLINRTVSIKIAIVKTKNISIFHDFVFNIQIVLIPFINEC